MEFKEQHSFDKNSDAVIAMFSDRGYFERKYEHTTVSYEVLEHDKTDEQFRIKCHLTMKSSAPVPGFAKKFLSETMDVVQEDIWDAASKTGRLTVELHGVPVKITADMALKDTASGCVNELTWHIKCGIPLVGGKLEKLIADDVRSKSPHDQQVSQDILQDY